MSQGGPTRSTGTGAPPIETITGNSGGAVGPDGSGNINLLGNTTMGINIVGNAGTNTLTVIASQASTTQFGTIQLATNAETIAGTDTAKAITADDLKAKLGTQTQFGLPIGAGNSSAISWTAAPIDGQLLIGSTGLTPVLSTLTAGAGITINNGPGSVSIAVTGGSLVGTGTTVGAVTADVLTIPLGGAANSFSFRVQVSGFDAVTPGGVGYLLFNAARTDGATATLIGTTVKSIIEDPFLAAANANIVVAGNDVIVQVTGVIGKTIDWKATAIELGAL